MQTRHASLLMLRLMAILAFAGTLALLGCPDDDENTRDVNEVNVALNNAAGAAALGGEIFIFAGGVEAFGTAETSTTVAFNNDASGADVAAGGSTASTTVEYASCTFTVASSDFPADHPLATGQVIRIAQCRYTVSAVNVPLGGSAIPGTAVLILNDASSGSVEVLVQLDEDGNLSVNEVSTGRRITGSEGEAS